jgi:glutamate/tyrosine decarboxylase-like PLP-dependent enzyme
MHLAMPTDSDVLEARHLSSGCVGKAGDGERPDYQMFSEEWETPMNYELDLLERADKCARAYVSSTETRRAFPDTDATEALAAFAEPFPECGRSGAETLALLDRIGSPATVASNGPRYFGFVLGATCPEAAAAERLALAWDQCATAPITSPAADAIERAAAGHVLDALDLPRESAVSFGTSASACALVALTVARRSLLHRAGWDFDRHGLEGAPSVRFIVPKTVHVTILKALRILGVGLDNVIMADVDAHGRIDPARLPFLDDRTVLCLQAGEMNTGEFDSFENLIPRAREAGAWVHVDGAFGLWARACPRLKNLTDGAEQADSWTVDGHKWLNTPYDGSMAIVRDGAVLAAAMNSDAPYALADPHAQKNLGLEFSRRARGIPIWAALHSLGREGLGEMVDRHCRQATRLANGLEKNGLEILNRVVINQVLVRAGTDAETVALRECAIAGGQIWFGTTSWQGRTALRFSVSSWRTTDDDIDLAIAILREALRPRDKARLDGASSGRSNDRREMFQ